MPRSVSTPDSGSVIRGPQNDDPGDLVIVGLRAHERPLELTPELIAEQNRVLDQDLDEELAALLTEETRRPYEADRSVIPGFEALTWADLAEARRIGDLLDRELPIERSDEPVQAAESAESPRCPPWCLYADAPVHTDGYDDPGASEHIGVRHTIQVTRGGATFGNPAAAVTVSVRLEQARDRHSEPVIVLTLEIDGAEDETYLGVPEATALRGALAHATGEAGR